jgi:hypothetical protein
VAIGKDRLSDLSEPWAKMLDEIQLRLIELWRRARSQCRWMFRHKDKGQVCSTNRLLRLKPLREHHCGRSRSDACLFFRPRLKPDRLCAAARYLHSLLGAPPGSTV